MILRNFSFKSTKGKKHRLNFSSILSKEYFNNRIIQIQMALNNDNILPLDYLIRRTKPKINSNPNPQSKKINEEIIINSYQKNLDKKKIPEQLEQILINAEKKFSKQRNEFFSLKNENDKNLGYWHYIDDMRKKNKKHILYKKYSQENNNKTGDVNLYSNEVEKLSENMFRVNPLLITKENIDLFFFYLGEFNKYYSNKEKYNHIKKKVINFLERLKDFLDYVEIKSDSNIDNIGKEIKMQNSKYIKRLNNRIKAELKNIKIKEKKMIKKEIKSAKKNIKQTQKTLNSMNQDKKFFEDPTYFDPNYHINYKNKINSRNKLYSAKDTFAFTLQNFGKNISIMNQTNKMSTASTGFFVNKNRRIKQIKNITKDDSCKNRNENVEEESKINFRKIKIRQKLFNKRVLSALIFPKNKLILKASAIKPKKSRNISQDKSLGSIESSFNNNDNNFEQNKLNKFHNKSLHLKRKNSFQTLKQNLQKNSNYIKILSPENIQISKSGVTPVVKINKNILKKKTYNNIITKSDIKEKKLRTSFASSNSISMKDFSSNDKMKSKIKLNTLYENLRTKPKIDLNDLKEIKSYFNERGKKIRNNLKLMDIISQMKKNINYYDIEQKTKKISQSNLTLKQKEKLQDVKNINDIIENLDIYYMNKFFNFKSKTLG